MTDEKKEAGQTLLSGVLDSPYGYMTVGDDISCLEIPNGWKVIDSRLDKISFDHNVPDHWIKTDNT
jgi:hypothetical protein